MAPFIRIVGDNIESKIITLNKALMIAQSKGLDLVEISPKADPPVCKVIDYKKFVYDQKKKQKAIKQKAQKIIIKETNIIKLTFGGRVLTSNVLQDGDATLRTFRIKDGDEIQVTIMSMIRVQDHIYHKGLYCEGIGRPAYWNGRHILTKEILVHLIKSLHEQWEASAVPRERLVDGHGVSTISVMVLMKNHKSD